MSRAYEKITEKVEKLEEKVFMHEGGDPFKFTYYNGRYIAALTRQLKLAEKEEDLSKYDIEYIKRDLEQARQNQLSFKEKMQQSYYHTKNIQQEVRDEEYYYPIKEMGADFNALLSSLGYNITAGKDDKQEAKEGLKEELITAGKNVLKAPLVIAARTGGLLLTVLTRPLKWSLNLKSIFDYYAFNKLTYSGDDFDEELDIVIEKMNTKANKMFKEKKHGR